MANNKPATPAIPTAPATPAAPAVELASGSYEVRIFVTDAKSKRGVKKATTVRTTGTLPVVMEWLSKQTGALAADKANAVQRVEIRRAAAETEQKLTF